MQMMCGRPERRTVSRPAAASKVKEEDAQPISSHIRRDTPDEGCPAERRHFAGGVQNKAKNGSYDRQPV